MISTKEFEMLIIKPYDYKPISKTEKKRVEKLVGKLVLEVANRFDGPSKIKVIIEAKGNA